MPRVRGGGQPDPSRGSVAGAHPQQPGLLPRAAEALRRRLLLPLRELAVAAALLGGALPGAAAPRSLLRPPRDRTLRARSAAGCRRRRAGREDWRCGGAEERPLPPRRGGQSERRHRESERLLQPPAARLFPRVAVPDRVSAW